MPAPAPPPVPVPFIALWGYSRFGRPIFTLCATYIVMPGWSIGEWDFMSVILLFQLVDQGPPEWLMQKDN